MLRTGRSSLILLILVLACSGEVSKVIAAPSIGFAAPSQPIHVGDTFELIINASTDTSTARGLGIAFVYDTAATELVGGVSGIVADAASPYVFQAPASIVPDGGVEIALGEQNFNFVSYSGPVLHVMLRAVAERTSTSFQFRPPTRFSPDLANTTVTGTTFAILGNPTPTTVPTDSPTPIPTETPTLPPTPTPSPTPENAFALIRAKLLSDAPGAPDLNGDTAIDIADLIRSVQP